MNAASEWTKICVWRSKFSQLPGSVNGFRLWEKINEYNKDKNTFPANMFRSQVKVRFWTELINNGSLAKELCHEGWVVGWLQSTCSLIILVTSSSPFPLFLPSSFCPFMVALKRNESGSRKRFFPVLWLLGVCMFFCVCDNVKWLHQLKQQ